MQIRDADKTDKEDTYAGKRGAGKTDTDVTEGDKTDEKRQIQKIQMETRQIQVRQIQKNTGGDLPLQYGHVIKHSSKWIIIQNTDDTAHVH